MNGLADAPVGAATTDPAELRALLGGVLPEPGADPGSVLETLASAAGPGVAASAGPRYFGFVTGGALPAALAADWLTSTWDQNAVLFASSPAAAIAEEIVGGWLASLLGLPSSVSFTFTTGCQMAHVTCLATARHAVLAAAGWDVERQGLCGAPPVRVLTGAARHVTVDRALRLLGLGTDALVPVAVDGAGRIDAAALERELRDSPTIVVAQAGEVNTGSFDPFDEIVDAARAAGAWVHVDGAFGLWAAASPAYRHLTAGAERADSWASDAHKWLNVPYDSGGVLRAPVGSPRRDVAARRLPRRRRARRHGLGARGVAARAGVRRVGGPTVARPLRCRGPRRPMLFACKAFRFVAE